MLQIHCFARISESVHFRKGLIETFLYFTYFLIIRINLLIIFSELCHLATTRMPKSGSFSC
jgi:hypothetical protein